MDAVQEGVETLYEADFLAWTEQQADALRRRDWSALDIDNLAEEIESMGRQQRAELRNRLAVLLAHLAKWQAQPELRLLHGRSWMNTADGQRDQIALHVRDNPSLKPYVPTAMNEAWRLARRAAARESGLSLEQLQESCPFTWEEAMRDGWMPE